MTVETTPTTEPSAATTGQRMERKYCVFAGSPGSRLTSSWIVGTPVSSTDSVAGTICAASSGTASAIVCPIELLRRLIAEDPEDGVDADDAEILVHDRHADARLREERVELRLGLHRPSVVGIRRRVHSSSIDAPCRSLRGVRRRERSVTAQSRVVAADLVYGQETMTALEQRSLVHLTHLQRLEAESIHIMREVVAECRASR